MPSVRRIVYPDADESLAPLLAGERTARLEALGELSVHYGRPADDDAYAALIAPAHAIILGWDLPAAVMRAAPDLEVIAFTGIGAANFVDLDEARRRGITVTNTPGYADETVAEHAIGLMLAVARRIARLDRDTRAGGWNKGLKAFDLKGKTLGLVGLGGIGARTAELARAFGMDVIAWTRAPDPARAERHGVRFTDLDALLAESDVISLHLALTPETAGLIDAGRLRRTKPGAVLVNTARGELVDEDALADLLEKSHLAGAGLDVFGEEPLPADHPFRQLENVVVTPHTGFNTPEATEAIIDIAIASLEAYYRGEPINVVT